MGDKRKKDVRRKSDLLVLEMIRLNRTIIDILRGRRGSVGPIIGRIRNLGSELGRRHKDRKVAVDYSLGPEIITRLLVELGTIEPLPRKIRLIKFHGDITNKFPLGTEIVGWELKRPRCSESYIVYLDNGMRFRTSFVLDHDDNYLRTFYSVYALEVLEEPYIGRAKPEEQRPITARWTI